MRVVHELGKYIAVESEGVERLRYNYQLEGDPSPSAPKPFCHPIRTPRGVVMTAESPLDHLWHRGVWFTWKFVNGVNYWEENQEIVGRQMTLAPPVIEPLPGEPEAISWTSDLEWRDSKDGTEKTRLSERRVLTCRLLEDGAMALDWHIQQTAREDVVLDRTPYTTWGGYGGLVARMTQAVQEQHVLFEDGTKTNRPTGERHTWAAFQGHLDTGPGRDHFGAFVFMPSPNNRRYPEPFYGSAKAFFNFVGPAPLFAEPLPLAAGEILDHAIRVLILPKLVVTSEDVNRYHESWLAAEQRRQAA